MFFFCCCKWIWEMPGEWCVCVFILCRHWLLPPRLIPKFPRDHGSQATVTLLTLNITVANQLRGSDWGSSPGALCPKVCCIPYIFGCVFSLNCHALNIYCITDQWPPGRQLSCFIPWMQVLYQILLERPVFWFLHSENFACRVDTLFWGFHKLKEPWSERFRTLIKILFSCKTRFYTTQSQNMKKCFYQTVACI